MKTIAVIFLFTFVACSINNKNELLISGDLKPGIEVTGNLSVDEPKTYTITLDSNSFVYGVVNQISVDVVINIKDSTEKILQSIDGPAEGPETFIFEAEKQGEFSIEVAPFKKDSGEYTIELKIVEPIGSSAEKRIDQLLYPYSGDEVPGGVIGVMKDGKLIFSKACGMANLTHNIKFEVNTLSNIGSVSKQFTATAILLLEQQGKLSTEDDIRKYIPELPEFEKVIKIKNLLNHTNGLWEILNLMAITGWKAEDVLLREEVLNIIKHQPKLQSLPGEEFNYNNSAFILLAEVVKRTTDTEFPKWMKENVFDPLKMEHSFVRDNPAEIIKNSSQGYSRNKTGYKESRDIYSSYGAGGIYTTIGDLAKWMNNFEYATLGGESLITKLVTLDTLNNGDTMSYACGIGVNKYNGLKRYSHGGADIAHRAFISYFHELKSGVAVLSNNANFPAGRIANSVADLFFETSMENKKHDAKPETEIVTVSEELLKKYSGKYKLEAAGLIIEFKIEDGKFVTIPTGQQKRELIVINDSIFTITGVDAKLTFKINKEGTVEKAILTQNGEHNLIRISAYKPSDDELKAFEGKYLNDNLETFYTISFNDSLLVANHLNLKEIKLMPTEEDSFTGDVFFMNELVFKRDKGGLVNSFVVSNGRTRDILFLKQ